MQASHSPSRHVAASRVTSTVQPFETRVGRQPYDVMAGLKMADALLKSGDAERALEFAEQSAQLDPDNAAAFGLRVSALMRLNRQEELVRLLDTAAPACMNGPSPLTLGGAWQRKASNGSACAR
jgi:cytochrome c-type biogenesis protein CcmH/NrfG